jgi:hypothetical protein
MKMQTHIAVAITALSFVACGTKAPKVADTSQDKTATSQEGASKQNTAVPVQRFLPLPETPGAGAFLWGVPRAFLALDTLTGELCKTWDWKGETIFDKPSDDQQIMGYMPECFGLYREFPKGR